MTAAQRRTARRPEQQHPQQAPQPGIIDSHHHVWDLSVRDQEWISGPELEPLRRDFALSELAPQAQRAGVSGTVLVQTVTVPEETPELLILARDNDLVAAVVGWTDLTAPDVGAALAALAALPGGGWLAGIRHQTQSEPDPGWLLRPEVQRGLAAVGAAGLVYDLVVLRHQLSAAHEAARRRPELTFVLDHLGKPPIAEGRPGTADWARWIRRLAALPNTVCKLSGMVTEADWRTWTVPDLRPYADTVLEAFGPERVMFGSDWPVCELAAGYAQVLDTARELTDRLTSAEQAAVFSGTATRCYGLGPRPAQDQE